MKPTLQKYIARLLLTGPLMVWSQTNAWESYYSYNNISIGTVSNQTIVTAAENGLFLFDTSQGTSQTITTVDGLSGDNISALATYGNVILVGHENGLLAQIDTSTKKIKVRGGTNVMKTWPQKARSNFPSYGTEGAADGFKNT